MKEHKLFKNGVIMCIQLLNGASLELYNIRVKEKVIFFKSLKETGDSIFPIGIFES